MGIGITAAGVRINREEKEKGKNRQQSWESLKRRWGIAMEQMSGSMDGKTDVNGKKEG